MTILRIPGYCAGDDLRGEPSSWLIIDTQTLERSIEPNPNYVPPPKLTELERLDQEIGDLEYRLDEAKAYRETLIVTPPVTSADADSEETHPPKPQ